MATTKIKQKKIYTVELIAQHPEPQVEPFFIYRLFETKTTALNFAKSLSTFFPYYEYPTKVKVTESDQMPDDSMVNPKVIYEVSLKDEQGKIVDGKI